MIIGLSSLWCQPDISDPYSYDCNSGPGFPSFSRRPAIAALAGCGATTGRWESTMNYMRTAILLAGLTALFMGVGYLIGGQTGALIALVVAAGMNSSATGIPTRWCCRCTAPRRSTRARRPTSTAWCATSPARAGLPMPKVYIMDEAAAERVRHRPQSRERGGRGHHRPAQLPQPRRSRRRGRARACAYQEPRHADHDDHRDHRRRDLDAGAVRHVLQRRQPQQQRLRHHRHARHGDPGADRRHAGADGDQPHARILRRQARRDDPGHAAAADLGAGEDLQRRAPDREPERGAATRPPRTCSSSTR